MQIEHMTPYLNHLGSGMEEKEDRLKRGWDNDDGEVAMVGRLLKRQKVSQEAIDNRA
jgi:hypothetical protein